MKKTLLIAPLLAIGFASPAYAQAVGGARVEARVGWDRLGIEAVTEEAEDGGRGDGLTFGAEVGYDAPIGTEMTVGAYAGLDFSKADVCVRAEDEPVGCLELGRNINVGARVGFPVAGTSLVYLKGGYSMSSLELDLDDSIDEDLEAELVDFDDDTNGFHFGTGIEFGFGTGLYGKVEYVFTDYSDIDIVDDEDDEDEALVNFDPDRHQLLLGVGFRF